MSAPVPRDWLAEVFRAQRDCGENIAIVFARTTAATPAEDDVLWFELPHDAYDGVSGLAELLTRQGLTPDALPVLREGRPSWSRRLRGLWSVLPYLGIRKQAWSVDFDWLRPVVPRPPQQRVAWAMFDEARTRALVAAAKAAGATVNTFLLAHLDAAVRGRWVPESAERRWMLPVNMRGAVDRDRDNAPRMSFLTVDGVGTPTVAELQAQVDRRVRDGQHWGMWPLFHAGRLIGEKGLRDDIRKRERQGHGTTGMFSNLGTWTVPGGGGWLFCPAITRTYPIGAGCITVNGRLALTLQLHEALGGTLGQARLTLDAWVRGCLDAAESARTASDTGAADGDARPSIPAASRADSIEIPSER